jgi:hypothetical protein
MVFSRSKLMRQKLSAMIVVVLGIGAMTMDVSHTSSTAQESRTESTTDLKKLASDRKIPVDTKAAVEQTVYGKVYSAWPMSDGTFYLGVMAPDGVHGFLFKTGDLKADAMVKAILMAQEKQFRVGAYDDPKTKMLGGICVFNR